MLIFIAVIVSAFVIYWLCNLDDRISEAASRIQTIEAALIDCADSIEDDNWIDPNNLTRGG